MSVLVVGMHRSGTSAVAGVLESLGLSAGHPTSLIPADDDNPLGYFESVAITALNDAILRRREGWWDAPPVSDAGLDDAARAAEAARIRAVTTTLVGERGYLVKDPRISLLLPEWRSALGEEAAAVLCVRDAADVAWSLHRRNGLSLTTGVALWAHYYDQILRGLGGMRVHVVRYADLLEAPGLVVGALVESFTHWGVLDDAAGAISAAARVAPEFRHGAQPGSPGGFDLDLSTVTSLHECLAELSGRNESFPGGLRPSVPGWVPALLEERRVHRLEAETWRRRYEDEARAFADLEREHLRLRRRVDEALGSAFGKVVDVVRRISRPGEPR